MPGTAYSTSSEQVRQLIFVLGQTELAEEEVPFQSFHLLALRHCHLKLIPPILQQHQGLSCQTIQRCSRILRTFFHRAEVDFGQPCTDSFHILSPDDLRQALLYLK